MAHWPAGVYGLPGVGLALLLVHPVRHHSAPQVGGPKQLCGDVYHRHGHAHGGLQHLVLHVIVCACGADLVATYRVGAEHEGQGHRVVSHFVLFALAGPAGGRGHYFHHHVSAGWRAGEWHLAVFWHSRPRLVYRPQLCQDRFDYSEPVGRGGRIAHLSGWPQRHPLRIT